jgi:hypothetical protein
MRMSPSQTPELRLEDREALKLIERIEKQKREANIHPRRAKDDESLRTDDAGTGFRHSPEDN